MNQEKKKKLLFKSRNLKFINKIATDDLRRPFIRPDQAKRKWNELEIRLRASSSIKSINGVATISWRIPEFCIRIMAQNTPQDKSKKETIKK